MVLALRCHCIKTGKNERACSPCWRGVCFMGPAQCSAWQRMRWLVASPTRWTWVWAPSGSSWWTREPGMLHSMGSQRVRHDWVTELTDWLHSVLKTGELVVDIWWEISHLIPDFCLLKSVKNGSSMLGPCSGLLWVSVGWVMGCPESVVLLRAPSGHCRNGTMMVRRGDHHQHGGQLLIPETWEREGWLLVGVWGEAGGEAERLPNSTGKWQCVGFSWDTG